MTTVPGDPLAQAGTTSIEVIGTKLDAVVVDDTDKKPKPKMSIQEYTTCAGRPAIGHPHPFDPRAVDILVGSVNLIRFSTIHVWTSLGVMRHYSFTVNVDPQHACSNVKGCVTVCLAINKTEHVAFPLCGSKEVFIDVDRSKFKSLLEPTHIFPIEVSVGLPRRQFRRFMRNKLIAGHPYRSGPAPHCLLLLSLCCLNSMVSSAMCLRGFCPCCLPYVIVFVFVLATWTFTPGANQKLFARRCRGMTPGMFIIIICLLTIAFVCVLVMVCLGVVVLVLLCLGFETCLELIVSCVLCGL